MRCVRFYTEKQIPRNSSWCSRPVSFICGLNHLHAQLQCVAAAFAALPAAVVLGWCFCGVAVVVMLLLLLSLFCEEKYLCRTQPAR